MKLDRDYSVDKNNEWRYRSSYKIHGKEADMAQLRIDIPKALITVLRLAEVAGVSEYDMLHAIEEKYNDKI